ncbi:MAG: hypothetical protein VW707_06595, partial [Candidatus Puniceispirillum sp.]
NCMTHKARVWLSEALYHRYVGQKLNKPRPGRIDSLLSKRQTAEAVTVGLGLRFALIFAAGTVRHLSHIRLHADTKTLTLIVDPVARDLLDTQCQRRFEAFANSAGCVAKIIIGA